MNRVKIILGYILGFIAAIILTSFVSLLIIKLTVFNKNYIKKNLANNNYYEKVASEVREKMENYMISSGLPETILNELYSKEEIKNDINLFIDNAYKGEKTSIDINKIKNKLNGNINDYISDHKVKVTSKSYIDSFVNNMAKFYEQEVSLYGMVNSYVNYIPKLESLINDSLMVLLIIIIILLISLVCLKVNFIGSIISASGLIILFIRLAFYEKIDYQNILIISDNFSMMLKIIIDKIGFITLIVSLLFIIGGTVLSFLNSLQNMPKKGDFYLKKNK